jgi:hypothetical protein
MELNELEHTILQLLLAGDDDTLTTLRKQLNAATLSSRKFTGVGFYTKFTVPGRIDLVPGRNNFEIADVCAELRELAHGAGFVLFIRDGVLSCLEGFTYVEPWPTEPQLLESYYVHHEPADSPFLDRCAVRDLDQLRTRWTA